MSMTFHKGAIDLNHYTNTHHTILIILQQPKNNDANREAPKHLLIP